MFLFKSVSGKIGRAFELSKALTGEGARGGKVVGHTKTGKPIYMTKTIDEFESRHKGFTEAEHEEAKNLHESQQKENYGKFISAHKKWVSSGLKDKDAEKEKDRLNEINQLHVRHRLLHHQPERFKKAPEFKGDWNKNEDLHKYMKEHAGKAIEYEGRKVKVGQEVGTPSDPESGMASGKVHVVAHSGEGNIIVHDPKSKAFDEHHIKNLKLEKSLRPLTPHMLKLEKEIPESEMEAAIKIETEHTTNKAEARKIALHHFGEDRQYYVKLKKYVEKSVGLYLDIHKAGPIAGKPGLVLKQRMSGKRWMREVKEQHPGLQMPGIFKKEKTEASEGPLDLDAYMKSVKAQIAGLTEYQKKMVMAIKLGGDASLAGGAATAKRAALDKLIELKMIHPVHGNLTSHGNLVADVIHDPEYLDKSMNKSQPILFLDIYKSGPMAGKAGLALEQTQHGKRWKRLVEQKMAGKMPGTWAEKMKGGKQILTVPQQHQKKIALSTLKMSDAGAMIMGGMSKDEARKFLKEVGYSDAAIAKLEE